MTRVAVFAQRLPPALLSHARGGEVRAKVTNLAGERQRGYRFSSTPTRSRVARSNTSLAVAASSTACPVDL